MCNEIKKQVLEDLHQCPDINVANKKELIVDESDVRIIIKQEDSSIELVVPSLYTSIVKEESDIHNIIKEEIILEQPYEVFCAKY